MSDRGKRRRELERRKREAEETIQRTAKHGDSTARSYGISVTRWEIDRINAQLREVDAEPWLEWAKRHRIKIPDDTEYWDTLQVDAAETQTVLNDEGKHFIKTAVREKRFRFMQRWGAIIAILTSILSLIISILALMKK